MSEDGAAPSAVRSQDYVRLGEVASTLDARISPRQLTHGLRDTWRLARARANGAGRAKFAGADDPALLRSAIEQLKATGVLEYAGEYGAELTTFIPFAHWLKTEGLMTGRRVISYQGMRPYYYFLDEGEFQEKPDPRRWLPPSQRYWPSNSTWHATRQAWHVMPDYRAHFGSRGMTFARPILFVQNKFTVEALRGPINYLPLRSLSDLFERTADHFEVVYSRPRSMPVSAGYTDDDNDYCDYPDFGVARRYPHVTVLEDLCLESGAPYNETKLEILAKAHLFVGVQGGGAHLLACFGNSLLLVLHYFGHEYPHAYALGPYKYLAEQPPLLLLARRPWQVERGVDLVAACRPRDGDLWLARSTLPTFRQLRF